MESKPSNDKLTEKRFALLIDADNVSAKYVAVILDELSKYGTVTYKRIYGDWTTTLHSKWKVTLLENSIIPIQQFSYTQGKNATDHAMIIDAMDILYTGQVDGFCIASSDSDFTRLAARIRESGLTVIGMGEKKTPLAFRKACDIFTTLEILLDEVPTRRGRKHTGHAFEGPAPSIAVERIEEAVQAIVTYNLNNGKATGLGEVGSRLQKRYPDFDVRSYGTNQLRKLLESFESLSVVQEGNSISVVLVDDAAAQAAASNNAASIDEPSTSPESVSQADEGTSPADVSNDVPSLETAEGKSDDSAGASDASEEAGKTKRTRRGGRRRKSTTIIAEIDSVNDVEENQASYAAQASSANETAESSAPEHALPASIAESPVGQTPEASDTETTSQEPAPKKSARTKASKKPARKKAQADSQTDEPVSAPEPKTGQTAETPAPKKRTRKKAAAQEASTDASAEASAPLDAPADVKPTEASDMRADIERYLVSILATAGDTGISLQTIGKRIRSKFRSFRLHDLGYTKLKDLVDDMDSIVIERRENASYALLKKTE